MPAASAADPGAAYITDLDNGALLPPLGGGSELEGGGVEPVGRADDLMAAGTVVVARPANSKLEDICFVCSSATQAGNRGMDVIKRSVL